MILIFILQAKHDIGIMGSICLSTHSQCSQLVTAPGYNSNTNLNLTPVCVRGDWGLDLWDRYEGAAREVSQGAKELESWYGGYLRDRAKVETEYAKALRKLVKNYTIKEKHRHEEDESTQAKGFR